VLGTEIEERDDVNPGDLLDVALIAQRDRMGENRARPEDGGENGERQDDRAMDTRPARLLRRKDTA
jgi:hypothetical protein